MKAHLVSLGCARNLVDSEEMLGRLQQAGWQITDEPETAHVIIVNTCSFIESAVDQSIDTILALAGYKERGLCRTLIVAGCLPERYRADIVREIPEVDVFLGTGAFDRIVEAAEGTLTSENCLLPDPDSIITPVRNVPRVREAGHMAYLKIAEGCSRHCTYCIIPQLRGIQKSRPSARITDEARALIDAGTKELILVAQDTTDYGRDLGTGDDLARLLAALSDLSGDIWLRVLYGHPESITDAMIRVMTERPNICAYFDLPIQHASDAVLKKMGRRHPREDLLRLFEKIRAADPAAALRTTAIVGFPGETEEDFGELLDFAETVRFDHLGVFTYSDSDDLPSHRLPGHVRSEVAQERYDRLMALQVGISDENNQKYLDRTLKVLIEESPEPGLFTGRTAFQAPEVDGMVYVHHEGPLKIGDFAHVRITDTLEYDLVGETE
ncbi:ribosomal protein S12 methylthiotransferase RimO [Desulfonema ishimotonii]|uniref:Ribosomal protein uS12 methylthiotransferase RimO n=1 Tax=Desulfonema ishimotonii TaxID=45657 RepID=A0A401G192_9BACT|nr:30S ribosomal protein S12 methylthiotransferase RimO [Desulfonema ishimotonii]GBC62976.1 ribosomal protein S12 methylthiotransferase RimO [Desulfonema ishimotonii]